MQRERLAPVVPHSNPPLNHIPLNAVMQRKPHPAHTVNKHQLKTVFSTNNISEDRSEFVDPVLAAHDEVYWRGVADAADGVLEGLDVGSW